MSAKTKQGTGSVPSISLRDLAPYILILASSIFNYATLTAKVDEVRSKQQEQSQRYDREVVPRAEHVEMNRRLEERLQLIQQQLADVQNRLKR